MQMSVGSRLGPPRSRRRSVPCLGLAYPLVGPSAEGNFDRSLVPVRNDDGTVALDREENPTRAAPPEALAALPPSFEALADFPLDEAGNTYRQQVLRRYPGLEITHVHHAGNSSGVVDGAGAVLFASPHYAGAYGLTPRARVVATANVGDDRTLMLNPPSEPARRITGWDDLEIDTHPTCSTAHRGRVGRDPLGRGQRRRDR
jgi:acetyl-CoA C-acetyltransferase